MFFSKTAYLIFYIKSNKICPCKVTDLLGQWRIDSSNLFHNVDVDTREVGDCIDSGVEIAHDGSVDNIHQLTLINLN